MTKAIIFDFDGVILQSADLKTQAFAELFRDYPDLVPEIVRYHIANMGVSRFVKFRYIYERWLKKSLSPDEERTLGEKFSEIIFQKVLHAPFVPGALEFLRNHSPQHLLFIASGTPEKELREIAQQRQIAQYFCEIHGSPRTKTEIILDICNHNNFFANDCVFIGDSETDLNAAHETKVFFIGVSTPGSDFSKNCRYSLEDLSHLSKMLLHLKETYHETK